jgi:hypothetical protein
MAIPKLEADVKIISQIPNYPGSEGGLTPEEFKEKFDEAPQIIKDYINKILIPELDKTVDVQALLNGILDETLTFSNKAARADAVGAALKKKLDISGGDMTGHMTVLEPAQDANPATKKYVDDTYMTAEVTLTADGWQGEGPYTQTVAAEGILATDRPHYGVVYTENWEAEKEAFALVDELDTSDGSVTFTCFEEKPGVDLTIQMEVNRGAESGGVSPMARLLLDDDESGYCVQAVIGDETYGVGNMTLNSGATDTTYDFTVL